MIMMMAMMMMKIMMTMKMLRLTLLYTQVCKGGVEGAWFELEAERSGCNCCLQVILDHENGDDDGNDSNDDIDIDDFEAERSGCNCCLEVGHCYHHCSNLLLVQIPLYTSRAVFAINTLLWRKN